MKYNVEEIKKNLTKALDLVKKIDSKYEDMVVDYILEARTLIDTANDDMDIILDNIETEEQTLQEDQFWSKTW